MFERNNATEVQKYLVERFSCPTHHTQCSLPEPMAEIVVRPGLGVFARKECMAILGMIHVAWLVVQTRRSG